jgi:hypothetical protein
LPCSEVHLRAQAAYATRIKTEDPEAWREKKRVMQAKVRELRPEKKSAWNKVYKAVKSGRLTRPSSCERCSIECRPEASHDDYAKPLEVEWLCKSCHMAKDSTLRRSKQ